MPVDVTLTPGDLAVLKRVPREWWNENVAGAEIAFALATTSADTLRRISRLVTIGLIQRRHGARGPIISEIRRIAKVEP